MEGLTKDYKFLWMRNGKELTTNSFRKVTQNRGSFKLEIFATDKERDEGEYECIAITFDNHTLSEVFLLTIAEKIPSNFTYVKHEGTFHGAFKLNIEAYSNATFTIYDKRWNVVSVNETTEEKNVYLIEITPNWLRFERITPKVEKSGNFTLIVKSLNGLYYKHTFEFLFPGKIRALSFTYINNLNLLFRETKS